MYSSYRSFVRRMLSASTGSFNGLGPDYADARTRACRPVREFAHSTELHHQPLAAFSSCFKNHHDLR